MISGLLSGFACFVDAPAQTSASTIQTSMTSTSSSSGTAASEASTSSTASTSPTASTSLATTSLDTMASTSSTSAESTTTGCEMLPWYRDSDNDGFGDPDVSIDACAPPEGYTGNSLDCDDRTPKISPDTAELCDMIDNDCDKVIDEWSPDNATCGGCTMSVDGDSVYHLCPELNTFAAGRALCQERGGDLVILETLAEGIALQTLINDGFLTSWLIGLTDSDTEGSFVWIDGTPLVQLQSNWAENEPNDSMLKEDCVVISSAGTWNDIDCASPRRILCEVPL